MAWKFNPFTNALSYYEKMSIPPVGDFRVVNWYIDSDTGLLVVEYEDNS